MKTFSSQKVLVVEDNFMSFKLIEAHFRKIELNVLHALDGRTAIDLFRENPDIALIIMDIQLPGMSGLDVTSSIREVDKEVPIIAATANVFEDDKKACLNAGCNDFITKPIDFPSLFELIEKYLS